jgi:tetratricopeptide (TPR) repeat protein
MTDAIELEIGLNRTSAAGCYHARASLKLPDTDRVSEDAHRDVALDMESLAELRDADEYGRALTGMLFGAPGVETPVKSKFQEARREAERNPAIPMRLRLRFEQEADELHALRWETLHDPATGNRLATDAHVLLSRILQPTQSGEAPGDPPSRPALKALVVIADPSDIGGSTGMDGQKLQRVEVAEVRRGIEKHLVGIQTTWLCKDGDGKPTRDELLSRLEAGCHLLYIACHGALEESGRGQSPAAKIWLEDEAGKTATVYAGDLIERAGQKTMGLRTQFAGLTRKPRLVVLSACQGGGRSHDAGALAAFGPRLVAAGVPAVIAMQDDVAMATADAFAEHLFRALLDPAQGGVIDAAVAVARSHVADSADWWAPALFMCLKSGRLWLAAVDSGDGHLLVPSPPNAPALRGRDDFLRTVAASLRTTPRVGMYGLPGVGKTAAALALANLDEVERQFPAGRAWLPLGPEPDLFAALGQLMAKFGVPTEGLTNETARADRLAAMLDGRCYLLLLDDLWTFEDASVFRDLCRPPAQMVITSRFDQVLDELQTRCFEVPPLAPRPSVEMLQDAGRGAAEAVAAAPNAGTLLVEALNRLPLALHVAGRQLNRIVRDTGPRDAIAGLQRELAKRKAYLLRLPAAGAHLGIADREPTLQAIVGLSYDYLADEDEKRAFRRLAVFGGQPLSFTARAMQDTWQTDEATAERLRRALIDARLLERAADGGSSPVSGHAVADDEAVGQVDAAAELEAEPRYNLHPILADYAAWQLAQDLDEEADSGLAHARHYAAVVAEANEMITGGRELAGLARLDVEITQVRRAITWAQGRDATDEAVRDLVVGLRNYAIGARNMHGEYGAWLDQALDTCRRIEDKEGEANVLQAQGDVLAFQDRRDEALGKYEAALALFQAVGDRLGEANVLQAQGDVLYFQKQTDEALGKYEAALALFQAVGDRLGEANVLKAQGDVLAFQDRRDEALGKYEAALALFQAVGDRLGEANVLKAQGRLALSSGQVEAGLADLEKARKLYAAIGDRVGLSNVGITLAQHAASRGDLAAAIAYLHPAAEFCLEIGHPLGPQLAAQIAAWQEALSAGDTTTKGSQ